MLMGFLIPYEFYVVLGGVSVNEVGLALVGAAAALGIIGALLGAFGIATKGSQNASQSETTDDQHDR